MNLYNDAILPIDSIARLAVISLLLPPVDTFGRISLGVCACLSHCVVSLSKALT